MADSVLEVTGIETCYGLSQVLFGMSFAIASGEMVTLMGRNGMGKTTTVRSIMGLTQARAGTIRFLGDEIRGLPSYKVAQRGIGLVPEGRQIFPNLSVRENLQATAVQRNGDDWTLDNVYELFPRLAERDASMGNQLSGGEQQMLAIARAMMLEPKIILLDEPTEGLMPRMVSQIRGIIEALHQDGVAILLVEQNVPLTLEASHRVYFMEKGTIRHHAEAARLSVSDPIVQQYLGV
jgi:branched-chain amino acid transport system ATP-binding protein